MQKLPRTIRCIEDQPNYDPEIWQPDWNCFACEDTGFAYKVARRYIDGYNQETDKFPVCTCSKGQQKILSEELYPSLDTRLTEEMCKSVDEEARREWQQWAKDKRQRRMARLQAVELIDELAERRSLRQQKRTAAESPLVPGFNPGTLTGDGIPPQQYADGKHQNVIQELEEN